MERRKKDREERHAELEAREKKRQEDKAKIKEKEDAKKKEKERLDMERKAQEAERIEKEKEEQEEERLRLEQIRKERGAAINSEANVEDNESDESFGEFVQHRIDAPISNGTPEHQVAPGAIPNCPDEILLEKMDDMPSSGQRKRLL